MSSDLTVTRLSKNSHLSKPLNQRDSSNPERILLRIRYENVRMTQTRLRDIMKSILDRSFRYTSSIDTDLGKTFARIRREQRQQTLAQAKGGNGKVLPITQRKRAVAS